MRAARTRSSTSSTASRATSQDPETKRQRLEARCRRTPSRPGTAEERAEARTRADLRIDALGSGSDYTPFLQHAGVPTLNLGFGGLDDDGIYHSIYDSFYHYTQFHDPDFAYGRALAQTVGTAIVRLADADLLPFEFTNVADTVRTYMKDLQTLLKKRQDEVRERNLRIDGGRVCRDRRSAPARSSRRSPRRSRRRSTSPRSRTPPRR